MSAHNIAAYGRAVVFPVDAVPIGAGQFVIDGEVAAHRHLFVEIAVVMGGTGQHVAEHGTYAAQVGDVFVIHPGAWHAYAGCHRCVVANCYFGAELLDRELAWMRQDAAVAPLLAEPRAALGVPQAATRLSAQGCEDYRRVIDLLVARTQTLTPSMRVECLGLLTAALGILAQTGQPSSSGDVGRAVVPHPAVVAAQQMLEERLAYPWTLVEMAYQLHIDRSYLVRLFKQATGDAPMSFLARRRAARAATLLRTTATPIGEIGCAVGWDDPTQFNRRFKAFYGMSASTYRAQG
jgi:AraC family transcriptional regulator, L-rhamnose operon transcriptional activator RhaR